jgi:lipopolysaccharide export system protein LptA
MPLRLPSRRHPLPGRAPSLTLLAAGCLVAAGADLVTPAPAGAQELGSRCDLVSYRIISSRETFQGARVTWLGAPSLACPDGLRIRADSAVVYEQTGRNELIGNVRFDTPERELRARRADYFERDGRLFAWGDVFLRDLDRGTEVRGDTLLYLEAGPQRPEDALTVYGGRPRAVLLPDPSEPGEPPGEPFRVVANRLRFEGERFFWGDGQVEVERGELQASADSLAYDQETGELILMRDARVVREAVTAAGGLLNLSLREERLESLRAQREARIETEDFTLTGEDVQITLDEEENVRTVTSRGVEGGALATLFSQEIRLQGELIRIDEAEEGFRTIRSTGRARGETAGREDPPPDPDAPPSDAAMPDRDWIEGDDVVARFSELPPDQLPEGEEGPQYRLETLEATGNARTLYRSPPGRNDAGAPEEGPEDERPDDDVPEEEIPGAELPREQWAISYVLADRIVVHLVEGDVDRLETEGNVRGIQLEPDRGRAAPGPAAAVPEEEVTP